MNRRAHFLAHAAAAAVAVVLLDAVLGRAAAALGAVAAILSLAWRFDNRTGTWLVLVSLVLVVIAILTALVAALTMFGG